jgi:hypothetical protein
MSSLVTSASVWTNDDTNPKKRQSSLNIRKTIKLRPDTVGDLDVQEDLEELKKLQPSTIDDQKESLEKRNGRVNELLNKMTSSDSSTDSQMGDFLPPPSLNSKRNDESIHGVFGPVQPSNAKPGSNVKPMISYGANNMDTAKLSNYQRSYEAPVQLVNKPYYASMGIGAAQGLGDNKVIEKLNYMIHLLEEQGVEKTNNITEEFILYTFLGVFIIFVVDSFSRSGKYIR